MKTINQRIKTSLRGVAIGLLTLSIGNNANAQNVARIAFQAPVTVTTSKPRTSTTYSQIFSMNPDGSGVVQLTGASASAYAARWSPGQQYLSFYRNGQLWVMDAMGEANGGRSFAVAPASIFGSDWSPDGSTLAFRGSHTNLYTVSVNPSAGTAGAPVLLTTGYWYNPSWSPDGTRIAANGSYDGTVDVINVFDAVTGATLATFGAAPDQNFAPQWSPDGTRIAFSGPITTTSVSGRNGKTTSTTYLQIFLANPDGTGLTQVTAWNRDVDFPTWSPDGGTLAFSSGGIYELLLGSNVATLVTSGGNNPDWNP